MPQNKPYPVKPARAADSANQVILPPPPPGPPRTHNSVPGANVIGGGGPPGAGVLTPPSIPPTPALPDSAQTQPSPATAGLPQAGAGLSALASPSFAGGQRFGAGSPLSNQAAPTGPGGPVDDDFLRQLLLMLSQGGVSA